MEVDPAQLSEAAAVIKARVRDSRQPANLLNAPTCAARCTARLVTKGFDSILFTDTQLGGAEVARNTGANVLGNPLTSLVRGRHWSALLHTHTYRCALSRSTERAYAQLFARA